MAIGEESARLVQQWEEDVPRDRGRMHILYVMVIAIVMLALLAWLVNP